MSSLKSYSKNTIVYNLTVANKHSYYVGASGALGHNAGCWDKLNEYLNSMGLDNLYIDRNKIAHISVIYAENLDTNKISKVKNILKKLGTEKIHIETGPIINKRLKAILDKKAIKGASYRGGKVIKADGIINEFILEFR